MGDAFPISGGIDPASFPFLLADLHRQGATGSLKVDGPSYQKALYFRGGRILFGSSNDPRDQLGAILIESGRLTPEQLDSASTTVGPGNPLAKVLADGGLVSQRDLGEAARAKVERILADLLATPSGSFEFEDDVLPKGAIDLKLVTPRLFVAAVRRAADQRFSQRHLGDADVVLRGSPPAEGPPDWMAELGPLPPLLDGRRTLRQAAEQARLGESDARQIACALLFLGLAEKVPDAAPVFETVDSDLDLAHTARLALDAGTPPPAPAPPRAPAPSSAGVPGEESPFFVSESSDDALQPPRFDLDSSPFPLAPEPEPEPRPQPQPTVIVPAPEEIPTLRVPPPAPAAPEILAAMPPAPAPEPPAPKPAPERGGRSELPLVPPPRRPAPTRPEEPEPTLQPQPASKRPSKADLEALDSLLNSRSLESPLAGSTSAPPARRPAAWDPSFGRGPSARGRKVDLAPRPSGRGVVVAAGVLAVLGAAVAGGWWYYQRGAATPAAASPSPIRRAVVPPAVDAGQRAPLTATATPTPMATEGIGPGAGPLPPATAPTAAVTPESAPPTPGPTTAGDPRDLLRRGDLSDAGRGFVTMLKQAPRGSHSIQLLVACAPETVTKAVANAGAPELFIVPVQYQGRACYRVCWGLFDSSARAESARASLPPYFRQGGARPKVVAAAELLP